MSRVTTGPACVRPGDRVLLLQPSTGHRYLVRVDGAGARKQRGLGVFDPGRLEGLEWGSSVPAAGKDLVALRPTTHDLHATVRRKAQIITAKDAAQITFRLGVGPGDRVLESGIGSGAATIVLASAVGDEGYVVVQELRQDFADWASTNLEEAGLADRVDIVLGDLTETLADGVEGPFDAVLLDQPEAAKAIAHIEPVLAPGARLAAYCPQVSQMEAVVKALGPGWCCIEPVETIERTWTVKERGARPAFEGLGHTAFLVYARWVGTRGGGTEGA